MEELVKKGLIGFLSIFLSSLILLYLAEYSLILIFQPVLLGFIVVCTIIAVILGRWLTNSWGNALAIFIAVMVVAFFWSWFSTSTILFLIMAVPSAFFSLILWKILEKQQVFTDHSTDHKHVKRHIITPKITEKYRYKRKR